jgi:predicted nucleic acid-binding protein
MMSAVCDTGPLTHLWQIDLWAAFNAFDMIHLPEQVVREVEQHVELKQLCKSAACTLEIHPVSQLQIESIRRSTLSSSFMLQAADLAVLVLTQKFKPDFTLTDDLTLRRVLEEQGHTPMGSVGLLLYAYKSKLLTRTQLDQAIDRLFVQSTLYLSPQFKSYVRKLIKTKLSGT